MADSLIRHLALVSESDRVDLPELMVVAAALQKQATRDLAPIWNVSATVDAFARLEDVPLDYWPVIVQDDIDQDGALGVHLDSNKQPYALVASSDDRDIWSQTAAHECSEMLVDPFGDRVVAGDSIKPDQGRVNYLVEICDPSEDARFSYRINGVRVSDFYTPHFFDPVAAPGVRYSYTGALESPRMTREGGYLSWMDLETGIWWQQVRDGDGNAEFLELGPLDARFSLREQIDALSARRTVAAITSNRNRNGNRNRALRAALPLEQSTGSLERRANALRQDIAALHEGSAGVTAWLRDRQSARV